VNVLITCAGRRTSLLKEFAIAVHSRNGIVVAADADGLAPAAILADHAVQVPSLRDSGYVACLEQIIKDFRVDLIVPTIDTELMLLAANRDRLLQLGCTALVSADKLIATLRDKFVMAGVFSEKGIGVPPSWIPEAMDVPSLPEDLFVKPRDGSASKHVYRVRKNQLDAILPLVRMPWFKKKSKVQRLLWMGCLIWRATVYTMCQDCVSRPSQGSQFRVSP